jgi:hypothetical protein
MVQLVKRTDHQHFTVRKVDEVDDAVHHGVAQRYQGVHAAENQTVDDLLQQYFHRNSPFFDRPAARLSRDIPAWPFVD